MRILTLAFLFITACGTSGDLHTIEIECSPDDPPPQQVDAELMVGDLTVNNQFIEEDTIIEMSDVSSQILFQVALSIDDLFDYDHELLRIEFTSDYSEWVGLSTAGTTIYETREDCLADTVYCEEIIVGEGTSGYFEVADGMLAIQNAYCRNTGETYGYQITASVFNIEPWPIEEISEAVSIQIVCHPDPDMSQTSGL